MSLNVCVECGTRVRRLVRKLQFDNYCLEKCVSKICTMTNWEIAGLRRRG